MELFFNIHSVFFTVMGYDMSYVEFFGTVCNILSVWLVARNKILNWPIGIIGVVLFAALYWQIQLYSDFLEQIYFLITGFWGWYVWATSTHRKENKSEITYLQKNMYILYVLSIGVLTYILGYGVTQLNNYFPTYFPVEASYPYLDSFTTVLSFVATYLMIRRIVESWVLWIIVDCIGVWLYYVKGVHLVSLLYAVFLCMAVQGLLIWISLTKPSKQNIY
jgi:nicotinamide mononucleotide transporter